MGWLSSIGNVAKKVGGALTGGLGQVTGAVLGSGGSGYSSPYVGQYEDQLRNQITARGGKKAGQPVTMQDATRPYDFSPVNQAIQGFKKPTLFKQTYSPSSFNETYTSGYNPTQYNAANLNYESLPEQYGALAYNTGAKDIRRESDASLQRMNESTGVRRPGLLLKGAAQNQRALGENLGNLTSQIQMKQMDQNTALKVQQQQDQAAENYRAAGFSDDQARQKAAEDYKGYASRSANEASKASENYKAYESKSKNETSNADNAFRYLQGLMSSGKDKIGLQSDLTTRAQADKDKAMDYLMELFSKTGGFNAQDSANATAKRGQVLGMIGSAGKAAAAG